MSLIKHILTTLCFLVIQCAQAEPILHAISGEEIPFAALKGKWVFINFWASWCQPCLNEIPELNRFYESTQEAPVALYGVNYDALPLDKQRRLIRQLNIRYPTLKKDPSASLNLGDINGVPVTFVFNPQGELATTLYGEQTVQSLMSVIAKN